MYIGNKTFCGKKSNKQMIDDQLNLDVTVNNVDINSDRPYGLKILEGLFKAKEVETQYQMDQTINLPTVSNHYMTDTNIDDEVGGNSKYLFNSTVLNISNILPSIAESPLRKNTNVAPILSEVSIEIEEEKSEVKQYQPEAIVVEKDTTENKDCLNISKVNSTKPATIVELSMMNTTKADSLLISPIKSERDEEKYQYYSSVANAIDFRSIEKEVLNVIQNQKQQKLKACKDWINKKKGTCFKVTVQEQKEGKNCLQEILEEVVFESNPEDFLQYYFLVQQEDRKNWDQHVESYDVLYAYEKDDTKYFFLRQCQKKVLMIKPREYIYCMALRKLETGDLIYGMTSYDDRNYPQSTESKIERGFFKLGGGYIRSNEECSNMMTNKTQLDQSISRSRATVDNSNLKKMYRYTLVDPRLRISIKIAKSSIGSYFKHLHKNIYEAQSKYEPKGKEMWNQKIKEVQI